MSDTKNEFEFIEEGDEAILPDGWGENDDIFDVDSWTGATESADASSEETDTAGTDSENEAFEDVPTTDEAENAEDSAEETEELPTTQEETKSAKLKFSATVDHVTSDIELDESDLPTIYQKAQVTDRVQARLNKMSPIYEQAERTAKMLGYDSAEEMLKAATDNYRAGEVEKLVSEGTPQTIAEDYIDRKLNSQANPSTQRDWTSEAQELADKFPELRGQPLPDEVIYESIARNEPLVDTYGRYKAKQDRAANDARKSETKNLKKENANLRKANSILKQNAEAASRAPVRGVSNSGVSEKEDDPFLQGFMSDGWD